MSGITAAVVLVGLGTALIVGALAPPPTWSASGSDPATAPAASASTSGAAAYLTSFARQPGRALRPADAGSSSGSAPSSTPSSSSTQYAQQIAEYQAGDDSTTPLGTTTTTGPTVSAGTSSTTGALKPDRRSGSTTSTTSTTVPATSSTTSTSTTTTTNEPTISAGTATNAPSVLGVFAGSGDPQALTDFGTMLGRTPTYAMDFLDGTSWSTITDADYPYDAWQGTGYKMIWGVDMLPGTYSPNSSTTAAGGSCEGLTQEAAGDFDSYFVTVAQNMVNAGFASSVIRIGWEFNGGWFPWSAGGCPSAFVGAFQDVVTAMRSVSGQQFTFEWNPTAGDFGIGDLADYYPGDAYVDYVGLDVYDVAWQDYPGMPAEFTDMETEAYGLNWLADFAGQHDKAIVLPEWGLGWGTCSASGQAVTGSAQVCGGDDGTFVTDMAGWIATHDVFEATFWDYGSSSVDDGSNPITAAALQASFG